MNVLGWVIVIGLPVLGLIFGGVVGLFVGLFLAWAFCRVGGF